ncbi:hypothetical protein SAY86_031950 [Trapa natans]|uniref:Uncharacterized protein n=1 Tax=Trapa natans TaxID=22666 RepID=A0AAN7R6I4_TRANT|nr:hypothetical protein SAY86_031950 [Trapa natans]
MEINLWERPGPNGNSNADEGGCEEHDLGWSRVDPPDDRNGKNEANMDMLQSSGGQSMCGCRIHEFTHPSSVLKTVEPESTSCGGYCSNGNHIQVQSLYRNQVMPTDDTSAEMNDTGMHQEIRGFIQMLLASYTAVLNECSY